jgi:ABC-2 type transport system ATP-binding protein
VDNLALVPRGCIYGLLGQNGAGKSTTLKMLTGLIRPTQGEVKMFGQPWQRLHLRRLGVLIESSALYGNLTAKENLSIRTILQDLPNGEVSRVLEVVQLWLVPMGYLALLAPFVYVVLLRRAYLSRRENPA